MKRRASQQFLAMQGDRLLGRSFLPVVPVKAGLKAAPEVPPPAFGAADLSDNVRMIVRLVSEAEQIPDGEVISRAVCHYAECHVGIPGLLGDFDRPAARRHANSQSADLQLVDGCLVDLPDFSRSANRFGVSAR
ncbi:hypothetical protein IG197_27510 [Aminobacter sp. SR38]|jgi:hypothetical protein|uniref:hypothetical protein n=1 Tax=Aminobacter sp. SR38 TaxID=2774562 RepID=UPI00177C2DB6|nr:hypothetical protein [Aminobacter sp. SR38]QOF71447.1 hypothetical protein IG197_27510 [Aminobacter sp. SR38]